MKKMTTNHGKLIGITKVAILRKKSSLSTMSGVTKMKKGYNSTH